jgi:hypothetical protein
LYELQGLSFREFLQVTTGLDTGSMRESFFINQAGSMLPVTYVDEGDFAIGDHIFEVGGKNKKKKQIRHLAKAYVAADDIEIGHQQKIPLWLFGFFY